MTAEPRHPGPEPDPAVDPAGSPGVSPMFAKLLAVVLALIVTGAALLAIRHQRLETMHRIAATRKAIDLELARQRTLQARIAELAEAERVTRLARELEVGPWVPRPERPVPADELVHAARVAEQREQARGEDASRPRFGPPALVDARPRDPRPAGPRAAGSAAADRDREPDP